MIRSFKHKGLERFERSGSTRGIDPDHAKRLAVRLEAMNVAQSLDELDRAGWKLHELKGTRSGTWSLHVNGPWCITFLWDSSEQDCYEVDYEQYHDKKLRR